MDHHEASSSGGDYRLKESAAKPVKSSGDFVDDASSAARQEALKLLNARYRQDTRWRQWLTTWVVVVDTLWLGGTMWLLLCNQQHVHLPPAVLVALLCTTTANVLGLAYIVLKGLFAHGRG